MTRTEKLVAIKQRCIEANPELEVYVGVYHDGPKKGQAMRVPARPIRLADVLLALRFHKVRVDLRGHSTMEAGVVYYWNLRADDLSAQSDETIDYVHSLLA